MDFPPQLLRGRAAGFSVLFAPMHSRPRTGRILVYPFDIIGKPFMTRLPFNNNLYLHGRPPSPASLLLSP